IYLAGIAPDLEQGVELASTVLQTGKVAGLFERFVAFTRSFN
ncbi:MAG: anthranilate phosphoribosyltransferase, partial [Gammaproteobacteria bacterium]